MSYLIKQVVIIDELSPYHNQLVDVIYKDGMIAEIASNINNANNEYTIIDGSGQYLSKSWIDIMVDMANPGFEYRESIKSATKAAINGGYGSVVLMPNTNPKTTTATEVHALHALTAKEPVKYYIHGSVSKNIEGKDLAEMLDMKHAGAVSFTDGWYPIQNDQLLLKALEYVKSFDGVIIQLPIHQAINANGLMNEGVNSVTYGMSGMPSIGESIIINRDITLAAYTQSKLHITGVSSKEGIELIRKAKANKIQVTCSVTPYHLLFTDAELSSYNSLYKVNPALRTSADVAALREAVLDGTIDVITSHHKPHNWDEKVTELEYAKFGMAALEVTWPMLLKSLPEVTAERWVQLLCDNPYSILGLNNQDKVDSNYKGTVTLFNMTEVYEINEKNKSSKAYNVPLINEALKGKARLIF